MLILQNQNAISAEIREDGSLLIIDNDDDERILIVAENIESFILGLQDVLDK
jgi:hypothetical protein